MYIGWKILRRAVSPDSPATEMLLPWKDCQREMTWYLDGCPRSTQYWRARRTASSTASVPVQVTHTRALSFSPPGDKPTIRSHRSRKGWLVKAWAG